MSEIICEICPHHCKIPLGALGLCKARKNQHGENVCDNYGQLTSVALDPIEKKPLNRFYPGSLILSVGSYGCNLRCPFCQNYEISMADRGEIGTEYYSPENLVDIAARLQDKGNIGVAFTYNEPLISWEYVYDTSKLLKEAGLKSVLVTNGTADLPVLETILPHVDAMNIDLKGFRSDYYQQLCGDLKTVQEFIVRAAKDCHVELTTLIVPDENDSAEDMRREAEWIASIGADIPLHVTRFFPRYHKVDCKATEVGVVYELAEVARKYLKYVYVGNC